MAYWSTEYLTKNGYFSISDGEHFFMCLLANYISSWEKGLFRFSAHFFVCLYFVAVVELYKLIFYFGN